MGRRPHRVDGVVQPPAVVHHLERLVDQRLQQPGRVGEGLPDPAGAHHRQAVAREQALRLQLNHPAQRGRPLPRVALHLLRVARVRRRPDEQVAAAQHLPVGHPGHRVIVGLALLVPQREGPAADFELQLVAVGAVGVAVVGGPAQFTEPELAPVDHLVVAGGEQVPVKPPGQRLVGDDGRRGPAPVRRLRFPGRQAADVVDVPVRVHGGVQPLAGPAPQLLMHSGGHERAPGVDQDQAVLGAEGRHVGEGRDERDAVTDLGQPAKVADRMVFAGRDLAAPEAVGQLQDVIGHLGSPSRRRPTVRRPRGSAGRRR